MTKAVLSNRIFLNRTKQLHDLFDKELTYQLPPKRPGLPREVVCDVTRVNKNILTIPIGRVDLIPETYEIVDKRVTEQVRFPNFKFSLREDQQEIYDSVTDSCVIQANPSWGKTFMGIALSTKLSKKTLVIVHTKHLMEQWYGEIKKTLGIEPGIIGNGKFNIEGPITVGTVQTIRNRLPQLIGVFGTVIVDECHHVPATVFKGLVDSFRARYKIGLTATPWRKDGQHVLLFNYFGGDYKIYIARDNNKVNPTIIMINSDIRIPGNYMVPWGTRLTELYNNPRYMELVLNLSQIQAQKGHLVLTVADRVEFLQQCHEILEDSMLVVGSVEDRDFLASKKSILLGTSKIYAEGVNIPPLSSLVMAMPLNNRGLLEQLLGRISRIHEDKKIPEAVDIMLLGNTGRRQAIERINFYNEKGYKIVTI